MNSSTPGLNTQTRIGDLALAVQRVLRRLFVPLVILLGIESAVLALTQNPGAIAFVLISVGTIAAILLWMQSGIGLPIVPMLSVQHLVAYGMPIAVGHEIVRNY